ncbi:hypothetical protein EG68_02704 [Paragonimus skrjabini miyazakii]|uniref:Uncharacterized protein n=1 Tax=Paragonimus skrjabini miyazakii TaxID=59628 RepID=A0A8S9YY60_9TREM|nr:hypothetical protein EG68_02704 [Paragonimus skrjabini miyazakii]
MMDRFGKSRRGRTVSHFTSRSPVFRTSSNSPRKFCDSVIHAAPRPELLPLPPSEWISYPFPLVTVPPELGV